MRLTSKDAVATVAVAAAGAIYGAWVSGAAFATTSTRVVGVAVFALGWVACTSTAAEMRAIYGPEPDRRPAMPYVVAATIVGIVTLAAGIAAIVAGSEAMLATMVVGMIALWAMATIRHAIAGREPVQAHPGRPAPAAR